jgi:hypothetical protein
MPTIARIGRLDRPLTIICGACGHRVAANSFDFAFMKPLGFARAS